MFEELRQQIIDLGIDIDLFFKKIKELNINPTWTELDKIIICHCILGKSRGNIAQIENRSSQTIGDSLSKSIYYKISILMKVEQEEIAGNWAKVINFLLAEYKLNPPLQLNIDNFQASFGRYYHIYTPDVGISQLEIDATKTFQKGIFYLSQDFFVNAWNQTKTIYNQTGNPETLIYLLNTIIERKKDTLTKEGVKICTLAVVVPFNHNQGKIAYEILRGIAQFQLEKNWKVTAIQAILNEGNILPKNLFESQGKIAFQFLVVNDPNNVYSPENRTAEKLAELAPKLNILAVLGHYSSEMSEKAIKIYAEHGLLLINSSSTSDQLSNLSDLEKKYWVRLTTPDSINAKALVNKLQQNYAKDKNQKVAIIYNGKSSYSTSYRHAVIAQINHYPNNFELIQECENLGENYSILKNDLQKIRDNQVNIIIVIPDGGIEPNSLNNAGLISRLNLNYVIAGSATLFQENVLHWLEERSNFTQNYQYLPVIACVPWHYQSSENGYKSSNETARNFCEIGDNLWGKENLTWRSATAYDSLLIIDKILRQNYNIQDSQSLLEEMDQFWKKRPNTIKGVTGEIQFDKNGDRINPPAEIVAVQKVGEHWKWQIL